MEAAMESFRVFDTDGSGQLSFDEFRRGVRGLSHGRPLTDLEIQKMWDRCDRDGTGTVDAEEFAALTVLNGVKCVSTIPAGKENVYLSLSGSTDLHTNLVAADGTGWNRYFPSMISCV